MILYNACSTDHELEYIIAKFDDSFEVESSYTTTLSSCECPQFTGRGKECRHIKMLGLFINSEHIDDNYFLEYETGCFHRVEQAEAVDEPAEEPTPQALQSETIEPAQPSLPLTPPVEPSPTRRRVA